MVTIEAQKQAARACQIALRQQVQYGMSMATLKIDLPEKLHQQLRDLVSEGWFSSETELVQEALRRFIESRAPDRMSRFIKEDVEWGLRGHG